MKKMFRGTYTALITPFDKQGKVDYDGLRKLIRIQIKEGVEGIVPLGTTGESPTIEDFERKSIIQVCIEESKGKIAVIVGTGSNSTAHTIKYTKEAKELGADAVLIVTPYYNKPTQEGIYRHFEAITSATHIPIIVYNIQGRSGVNITTDTLVRLAKLKDIVGVKEASGSISQMGEVISRLPADFSVLSGDDELTLPLLVQGGHGVISVISNLYPGRVSQLVNYGLVGEFDKARKCHYDLLPVFKAMFIETNPIPIKAAMAIKGYPSGGYRLPMCEPSKETIAKLKEVLRK